MTQEEIRELHRLKTVASKKLTRVMVKTRRCKDNEAKLLMLAEDTKPLAEALRYINALLDAHNMEIFK